MQGARGRRARRRMKNIGRASVSLDTIFSCAVRLLPARLMFTFHTRPTQCTPLLELGRLLCILTSSLIFGSHITLLPTAGKQRSVGCRVGERKLPRPTTISWPEKQFGLAAASLQYLPGGLRSIELDRNSVRLATQGVLNASNK